MRQSYPRKYLFTQLSGLLVGCVGLFLVIGILRHFPSLTDLNSGSVFLKIAFILFAFGTGLIGFMLVWGRILVILGILSKEEAKGYPYSKPWERDIKK